MRQDEQTDAVNKKNRSNVDESSPSFRMPGENIHGDEIREKWLMSMITLQLFDFFLYNCFRTEFCTYSVFDVISIWLIIFDEQLVKPSVYIIQAQTFVIYMLIIFRRHLCNQIVSFCHCIN